MVQSAFAQDELHKGVYTVGGSALFNYGRDAQPTATSDNCTLSLQPTISGFITDRIMLGIGLSYIHTSATITQLFEGTAVKQVGGTWEYIDFSGYETFTERDDQYTVGPLIRYYVPVAGWYPFVGGSYQISGDFWEPWTTTQFQLLAGVDFFIAHGAAIEPQISYTDETSRDYKFHGFQIGVGMSYFITPH